MTFTIYGSQLGHAGGIATLHSMIWIWIYGYEYHIEQDWAILNYTLGSIRFF